MLKVSLASDGYEKHCQDNAAQRNQSSSMPGIAITVLSHFIDRYEKSLMVYDTEECKYYDLQSIDLHEEVMIWRIN
jgi:hypothetical protein